jgi:hypothetical protein
MAGRRPTEEQYPLVFWAKKTNSFKPSAKKNLSVAYHLKFTVLQWFGVCGIGTRNNQQLKLMASRSFFEYGREN